MRWCSSRWEVSQEELLGGQGDDLSLFITSSGRMEMKCVIRIVFRGSEGHFLQGEQQFY